MKTVLALRHVHFEDLGTLERPLRDRGFDIRYQDPTVDNMLAEDPTSADILVVLGGPIGAFDQTAYPFLEHELRIIEHRLSSGRPLLGICLGAQLIARLLGANVAPMGYKEIGFSELTLTEKGRHSPLAALSDTPVLHWHGDQFEIPPSATLLASTTRCKHQAYAIGNAILGLQFHLETDANQIERWLVGHACELAQAGIDPREVREAAHRHGPALRVAAQKVIDSWLDKL